MQVKGKTDRITMALSRIMENTSGIRSSKRRLLAWVTSSVILYAAPIWASAMAKRSYAVEITSTQRLSALRVVSAYSTVSDNAACILAGMPPIELIAEELQKIRRDNLPKRMPGVIQFVHGKVDGAVLKRADGLMP